MIKYLVNFTLRSAHYVLLHPQLGDITILPVNFLYHFKNYPFFWYLPIVSLLWGAAEFVLFLYMAAPVQQ